MITFCGRKQTPKRFAGIIMVKVLHEATCKLADYNDQGSPSLSSDEYRGTLEYIDTEMEKLRERFLPGGY